MSTKLDGYIWIAGNEKIAHIPEKEQQNIVMEDPEDDDDADEELKFLPRLNQCLCEATGGKAIRLSRKRGIWQGYSCYSFRQG